MMTYREILKKENNIEVEHYEDIYGKPMSAVYIGYHCICYFEEDIYGKTPMDKEPVEIEEA